MAVSNWICARFFRDKTRMWFVRSEKPRRPVLDYYDRFMKMILREVALPMRRVFRIAHGETVLQTNLILELQDGAFSGYGEGASLDYYGITARSMRDALESIRDEVESATWKQPD